MLPGLGERDFTKDILVTGVDNQAQRRKTWGKKHPRKEATLHVKCHAGLGKSAPGGSTEGKKPRGLRMDGGLCSPRALIPTCQ